MILVNVLFVNVLNVAAKTNPKQLLTAGPVAGLLAILCACAAVARSDAASPAVMSVSANWAGYVAVGPGSTSATASPTMKYTDVTGQWVQPTVNCQVGQAVVGLDLGRPRRVQRRLEGARTGRHRGRLRQERQGGLLRLV